MKTILSLFVSLCGVVSAFATPVRDKHVEAELISEVAAIQPGRPFRVGLRLAMDEHWHTYWINPGDSGLGTKLAWDLPDGFVAGPIQWPYPRRIDTPPLTSYGYEGEALLLVEITPPDRLAETNVTLKARADWLMCKDVCIPGRAELALTLAVGERIEPDTRWTALFERTTQQLPQPNSDWRVSATRDAESYTVTFAGPRDPGRIEVFPYAEDVIEHAAPQQQAGGEGVWTIRLKRSTNETEPHTQLLGVAVSSAGWHAGGGQPALAFDIPVQTDAAPAQPAAMPTAATPGRAMTLPLALLLAALGGLILNLMPCVFPVISIKVLGFVEQAGESRGRLLMHGLVFAAGVLICFWILAGTLLALRATGSQIGWGFQLQSPRVVMSLAALFFCLGLSLFGLIEFGLSLTGAGQQLQSRAGFAGSFFSGLLATVVATPCTAPFMGAALGYALALPPAGSLAIFTALGAGMAAPYVVLTSMPSLIRRIPRPGPWMESMKQFMGFLMMATVIWLLWVLSLQTGAETLIRMAGLFLALGLAMWIAGRWGALHRAPGTRIRARIVAGAIALAALASVLGRAPTPPADPAKGASTDAAMWTPFSPERLAELRAAGTPVFIDFTAAWCLTCQVNKRVALHRREVEEAFRARGIVTLKADWTDRDETITRALTGYGRSGVPLYVLYGRDPEAPPVLLPELLTPGIVLDAISGI